MLIEVTKKTNERTMQKVEGRKIRYHQPKMSEVTIHCSMEVAMHYKFNIFEYVDVIILEVL